MTSMPILPGRHRKARTSSRMDSLWNRNYIRILSANFLAYLSFMLIVPLLPLYLNETFGADKQTIGIALAGYTVMALLARPFSGYIVDTFPRKTVLLICNFLFMGLFLGYVAAGSLTLFAIFRTLHGAPFGSYTVAASTVAIDVLPSSRRTEGIGYYGLSNNLATALGPVVAVYLLDWLGGNYRMLFMLSFLVALLGLALSASVKLPVRESVKEKKVISLDRFFLLKGWREAVSISCFAFSYGVLSTYVAIYGKQDLGITSGTGLFFTFFALGLIISRLTGARALRENRVNHNAAIGSVLACVGFLIFAAVQNQAGYYLAPFVIGLGNGHMYPAFQNMFINLATNAQRGTANSSILTSWDAGVGLGVLLGGVFAQYAGYHSAFWAAVAVNAAGVAWYFIRVRRHFELNKLR